ncbi:iron-sulfur cluster biosynthesis family protein [Halobacillus litoralis]|uniref:Iron-sulfur cluster biosynthesis family protein n=1 Tax=Halobacillus litoralis TaxID=45668 RepID=A0A845DPZ1_9BACI|nr:MULTISPECIES: iron-sulfur cluster biosynthesis family protein [Halobacillus]MYL19681.1 iron-sulfur cluster biosynthesis family protein [Halobacillus litoralis]MYL28827.1 iron-sulfur cluster biosynthesis family protein [Halobacillus halophilus]MYL37078.1 iron-sulfur cluster biosynthesis family protein [Halobacillus litoralis]
MKLRITDEAKQQLEQIQEAGRPILRLFYDTEGCGCGVNGLPTIRLEHEERTTDERVENEDYPVIIDNQQAIFFKKDMKLDFVRGTFRLSSPDGILNPIIPIKDVKEGATI